MNLFSGHWTEDGWQGKDFAVALPPSLRHAEGQRGIVGIRPQHVQIAPTLPGDPLRGRVTLIEPLVSERVLLVHLEFNTTELVGVSRSRWMCGAAIIWRSHSTLRMSSFSRASAGSGSISRGV